MENVKLKKYIVVLPFLGAVFISCVLYIVDINF